MRILFASMPFDGHFLPVAGIARHLRERGHEVRFYTGASYAERLARIDVRHEPFRRATELNAENLTEHFPAVERLKGPRRIAFDLEKVFFGNVEAHLRDVQGIREEFPFDALVADGAFYAAYPLAKLLGTPVYGVMPSPTPAPTSPTAPPPFFGLTPATNPFARTKHRVIRAMVESTTKPGMRTFNALLERVGVPRYERSVFDLPSDAATLLFQTGVPEMDFPREDWPAHHRFVGALLPPRTPAPGALAFADDLDRFASLVVVSQGTVDNRDPDKLLAPTLTALAGTEHLVVACTGGRHTAALRERFPQPNVRVEDWIDFDALFPHADVFVTNGGYGSVMQALMAEVPILAAGEQEGKNDINARLAYRGLAVDLRTERPSPKQLRAGVERVLGDPTYKRNVQRLAELLRARRPYEAIEDALLSGAPPGRGRPGPFEPVSVPV